MVRLRAAAAQPVYQLHRRKNIFYNERYTPIYGFECTSRSGALTVISPYIFFHLKGGV